MTCKRKQNLTFLTHTHRWSKTHTRATLTFTTFQEQLLGTRLFNRTWWQINIVCTFSRFLWRFHSSAICWRCICLLEKCTFSFPVHTFDSSFICTEMRKLIMFQMGWFGILNCSILRYFIWNLWIKWLVWQDAKPQAQLEANYVNGFRV